MAATGRDGASPDYGDGDAEVRDTGASGAVGTASDGAAATAAVEVGDDASGGESRRDSEVTEVTSPDISVEVVENEGGAGLAPGEVEVAAAASAVGAARAMVEEDTHGRDEGSHEFDLVELEGPSFSMDDDDIELELAMLEEDVRLEMENRTAPAPRRSADSNLPVTADVLAQAIASVRRVQQGGGTVEEFAVRVAGSSEGTGEVKEGGGAAAVGPTPATSMVPRRTSPTPMPSGLLATMQADTLHDVLSFLTGSELARISTVCRTLRGAANSPRLWRTAFWADFQPKSIREQVTLQTADPRALYRRRILEWKRRVSVQQEQLRRAEELRQARMRQRRLHVGLDVLHIPCMIFVPFLLLLIFSIELAKKMDGESSLSYAAVFSPIFALLGIATLACASSCIARKLDNRGTDAATWYHVFSSANHRHISSFTLREVGPQLVSNVHCTALGCCILLLPIMCVLKLDDVIDWPWGAVAWPLWLGLCLFAFTPCARWAFLSQNEGVIGFVVLWAAVLLPSLIVMIVLAAKLDGADIPLRLVLIPYWILDAIAVVGGLVIYIAAMVKSCRNNRGRREYCEISGALFAWYTVCSNATSSQLAVPPY